MMKKRKTDYVGLAKETVGVGIATGAGQSVLGSLAAVPGAPGAAQTGLTTASSGLNLVATGQLAKVGMGLAKSMTPEKPKNKSDSKVVNKILGW